MVRLTAILLGMVVAGTVLPGCVPLQKIKDNKANRNGCHPERERIPWLKRIAAKENLESPNKAIKRAAQIKEQEDLVKQKIKAIKYLGIMGCCCYDEDGSVTEALLAALDDCTPLVRKTTVEVISGNFCGRTGPNTCTCKKELVEKLADMAWGIDDKGCYKEPDPEIRGLAAQVVCSCCPNSSPGPVAEPMQPQPVNPVQEPIPETIPDGGDPAAPAVPAPNAPMTFNADGLGRADVAGFIEKDYSGEMPFCKPVEPGILTVSSEEVVIADLVDKQYSANPPSCQPMGYALVPEAGDEAVAVDYGTPTSLPIVRDSVRTRSAEAGLRGKIEAVDARNSAVSVQLERSVVLPVGTRMVVFHRYVMGKLASVAEFEVVGGSAGNCVVRPVGSPSVSRATVGATIMVVSTPQAS